jgi:hypothetical protein
MALVSALRNAFVQRVCSVTAYLLQLELVPEVKEVARKQRFRSTWQRMPLRRSRMSQPLPVTKSSSRTCASSQPSCEMSPKHERIVIP